MSPPSRLLLLGLDAFSAPLLERWIEDGSLPNLGAMKARGLMGRTTGVEGFFVGSTWPSLYTGTNPARHGVHYQLQIVPGTDRLHWCPDAEFVRTEPFWMALSDAGLKLAVLDVPLSRLGGVNGVQVVEWGGHDHLYGFRTAPAALGAELLERHGAHPLGPSCDGLRDTAEDWRSFVQTLEAGIVRKTEMTLDLLSRGDWDAFIQVFTEAHCAGHQGWHLHDPAHPGHDPGLAAATGDPLHQVYVAIDGAVGRILEAAGDARVVVFAAHDMSHWYGAQFMLPAILEALGVTVFPPAPTEDEETVLRGAARRVWNQLPARLQDPVRTLRDRWRNRSPSGGGPPAPPPVPEITADLTRSACFPLNNGQAVGGIRLNLAGREPGGLLAPGEEADAFCRKLAEALLDIVDERSGDRLVRRVLRTRDLHEGPHLDALPDLLVEWNDAVPTGSSRVRGGAGARVRARSPGIGLLEGSNEYGRTGEHRPDGWFMAAGPGIEQGVLPEPVSILDLAPTFTGMLGVPMAGCDGNAIPQLAPHDPGLRTAP
jgi:predicted AlkP superfamily phosphohydrolase/phosphomutase